MAQVFEVKLGKWRVDTIHFKGFIVDISALSNYNGGGIEGKYHALGRDFNVGLFPFSEITKMEKIA